MLAASSPLFTTGFTRQNEPPEDEQSPDPKTNELLYTKLESVRTNMHSYAFFTGLLKKYDGSTPLKDVCNRHDLYFHYEKHVNRTSYKYYIL